MKTWITPSRAVLAAALAVLAGCQTAPQSPAATAPQVDPPCVVTQAAYNHIHARHCTPNPGANQFLPAYCSQAGMQNFCTMVQTAPNQNRVVQPDGRIRYDSNLGQVVGTAGERCGRLIITSLVNGDVVTEFPESANAPPVC